MGFVVTGYVTKLGRRDNISKKLTKRNAIKFKKTLNHEMKIAVPKYKWVSKLKIIRRL